MEGLKSNDGEAYLPVLVITAQPGHKMQQQMVRERTAELRESEARFRALTELASDWYWEQDETSNFTKVSGPVLEMLGIRREGITEAAGNLQRAGCISYRRGHISVLDRSGLETRACECYAVVKKELGRLMSDIEYRQDTLAIGR